MSFHRQPLCFIVLFSACLSFIFFFFNDTATTEIYTLSLHDALPISVAGGSQVGHLAGAEHGVHGGGPAALGRAEAHGKYTDRKSTRLNSSHLVISYAVFCLKKKKKNHANPITVITDDTPYVITLRRL